MKYIEYLFVNPVTNNWLKNPEDDWDGPGWYFWDETEAECHGPCNSAKEAEKELKEYALSLDSVEK